VTTILAALAGGDGFETLEKEFSISADDIRACVTFAKSSGETGGVSRARRGAGRLKWTGDPESLAAHRGEPRGRRRRVAGILARLQFGQGS
jgi:hypothetical protein